MRKYHYAAPGALFVLGLCALTGCQRDANDADSSARNSNTGAVVGVGEAISKSPANGGKPQETGTTPKDISGSGANATHPLPENGVTRTNPHRIGMGEGRTGSDDKTGTGTDTGVGPNRAVPPPGPDSSGR